LKLLNKVRLSVLLALMERLICALSLIASLALAAASGYISSAILHDPALRYALIISSAAVYFSTLDAYQKSILLGFEAWKTFALASLVPALFLVPLTVALTWVCGLAGALYALSANSLVQYLTSQYFANWQKRKFGIDGKPELVFSEWRVIINFGLPALLSGALVVPTHWFCQLVLSKQPQAFSEVAILGVSMQWFNVLTYFPGLAGRVLLPLLTKQVVSREAYGPDRTLKIAIIVNLILTAPIAITLSVISPWMLRLYGSDFVIGWKTFSVVAITSVFVVGAMPIGQMLAAANKMWSGAAINLIWAAIYILLSIYFVRVAGLGAFGVASSLCAAYLIHSVVICWYGCGRRDFK